MSDLIAFVRARLDEDEAGARATAWNSSTRIYNAWEAVPPEDADGAWRIRQRGKPFILLTCEGEEMTRHIARHDPARVLAEIEAKRQLVDAYAEVIDNDIDEPYEYAYGWANGLGLAVRCLAAAYATHPDYRPEWAPTA